MIMKYTDNYEAPEMTVSAISGEQIICASPTPGGNEEVGYEDWTF